MIGRRAVVLGIGGLVLSPAVLRAGIIMPIRALVVARPVFISPAPAIAFQIMGWEYGETPSSTAGDARVVPIRMMASWRSAWF